MKFSGYLLILLLSLSCNDKKSKKHTLNPQIENNKKSALKHFQINDSLISDLPIGDENIILDVLNSKDLDTLILDNIFKYYDTINGVASPFFKRLKIKELDKLYKPKKADTINEDDRYILESTSKYDFFKVVKILPHLNKNYIMIFEGKSYNRDYDGNTISINRKDLAIINFDMEVINEINLYYEYNDGINVNTKYFFIDEKYNIYLRYYYENEEGVSEFSKITKYKISNNGELLK